MGGNRRLLVFSISTAVVVAVFAGVATVSEWWVLPVALAVHFAGFAAVMAMIGTATAQEDKPDPVTEARLAEESAEEEDVVSGNGTRRPEKRHMGI